MCREGPVFTARLCSTAAGFSGGRRGRAYSWPHRRAGAPARPTFRCSLVRSAWRIPSSTPSGTMEIFDLAEVLGPGGPGPTSGGRLRAQDHHRGRARREPRAAHPGDRRRHDQRHRAVGRGAGGLRRRRAAASSAASLPADPQHRRLLARGIRRAWPPVSASPRGSSREARWTARAGLELNISCPNVHTGCVSIGSHPGETEAVVAAVRKVWPGLLVAKLTPNVTDITAIGRAAEAAGADALAAVNTFKGLVIDRRPSSPIWATSPVGSPARPSSRWPCERCTNCSRRVKRPHHRHGRRGDRPGRARVHRPVGPGWWPSARPRSASRCSAPGWRANWARPLRDSRHSRSTSLVGRAHSALSTPGAAQS